MPRQEELQDAVDAACSRLPLIILSVYAAGEVSRSEESRKNEIDAALKMLFEMLKTFYAASYDATPSE